ncbi:MAG: hypothetical protein ACC628_07610 [Pirellulaceae bacterium]
MAEALDWVSRIMAVTLVMLLPGLGGHWVDKRLGTEFLVLVGFALGLTVGVAYLIWMTQTLNGRRKGDGSKTGPSP